jgi:hypothetical protein
MTSKWGIDLANKSNPKLGGTIKKLKICLGQKKMTFTPPFTWVNGLGLLLNKNC